MATDLGRFYFLVAILFLSIVLCVDALCPSGRFGNDCRSECHCSTGGPCNEVTGACNDGCATGYSGGNCQLSNVALNKPATQSSTGANGNASRAVDGNTSPYYSQGSCTHTYPEANPWWRVDLQAVYAVYEVTITNRADNLGWRLRNVDIRVSNRSTPCNQDCDDQQCKHIAGNFDSRQSDDVTCDNIVYGQYLYVSIRSTPGVTDDVLTLCEVEVKGYYHTQCEDFIGGPTFLDDMTIPGPYMHIYPTLSVAANGVLVGWKFNAGSSGTVWFDIWRPTAATNTWQLVNKTQVTASYTGEQLLMLPSNERFSVHAGDLIGYHYNAGVQSVVRTTSFHDHSCCAGVDLQEYPVLGLPRYDDSLSVGVSITGDLDHRGRAPALQAIVVSDEKLSHPSAPTNLTLTTERQGTSLYAKITVAWNAVNRTSCITNNVIYHKQSNAAWNDSYLSSSVQTVEISGLTGFTSYDVRVEAVNKYNNLISKPITATIITAITEPSSAPVNFRHTSRTDSTIVLIWEKPIQPRGIITNYKVLCELVNSTLYSTTGNSTTGVPISSESVMEEVLPSNTLSVLIKSLHGASQYNCSISGNTSVGNGDVATHVTWTGPPGLTEWDLSTVESAVNQTSVTGTTITMMLKPFKSRDGVGVSEYQVVVDKKGNNRKKRASFDEAKVKQLYGHDEAIGKGLSHYITANFIPSDILSDGIEFIVGDGKMYGGYTNEPLEEGSTYDLWYGILRSVDGVTTASYVFVATVKTIVDTNECTSNRHNCSVNAYCIDTPESFSCRCMTPGYQGNGYSCTHVEEDNAAVIGLGISLATLVVLLLIVITVVLVYSRRKKIACFQEPVVSKPEASHVYANDNMISQHQTSFSDISDRTIRPDADQDAHDYNHIPHYEQHGVYETLPEEKEVFRTTRTKKPLSNAITSAISNNKGVSLEMQPVYINDVSNDGVTTDSKQHGTYEALGPTDYYEQHKQYERLPGKRQLTTG